MSKAHDALKAIERSDVLAAIEEISEYGIPSNRKSHRFCLEIDGRHFAPKYVVGVASGFRFSDDPNAQDRLQPDEFAGGPQSNDLLGRHGFKVIACGCGGLANGRPATVRPGDCRLARIIIVGKAAMSVKRATKCLTDVAKTIERRNESVEILLTPGGLIVLNLEHREPIVGWETPAMALARISQLVESELSPLVQKICAVAKHVRFLTLGVDVFLSDGCYAELVATVDVQTGHVLHTTGKSYPTPDQEKEGALLHITDLASHFQTLSGRRCLVLGCHDLNVFSARSIANRNPGGFRGRRADEIIRMAQSYNPEIVLQHPHTTDTANIWAGGWAGIRQDIRPLQYASGICYHWPKHGRRHRAPLKDVLRRTATPSVRNYIWESTGKVHRAEAS